MHIFKKLNPVLRATGTIGATAALVTGITFAALSSSATLTNNTISAQSATEDLVVSLADPCTDGFDNSLPGLAFEGIVPGSEASDPEHFCLKNTDDESEDANLDIVVTIPMAPTFKDSEDNPVTVDNTKVLFDVVCTGAADTTFGLTDVTLATLLTPEGASMGTLATGETADCDATVSIDDDAFEADSIISTGFDLVFTGTGTI